MLEIIRYPNPILREVSRPVEIIDEEIRKLALEMIDSMYEDNGVGLAAPQIGRNIRLVIVDLDPRKRDPQVMINPVITGKSKEKETVVEGCLSVPGIEGKVTRAAELTVQAQNLDGDTIEYSGDGIFARAVQHEIDHLDGILFIDKLSPATKLSIRAELARLEENFTSYR
jgi:peptide deformylase